MWADAASIWSISMLGRSYTFATINYMSLRSYFGLLKRYDDIDECLSGVMAWSLRGNARENSYWRDYMLTDDTGRGQAWRPAGRWWDLIISDAEITYAIGEYDAKDDACRDRRDICQFLYRAVTRHRLITWLKLPRIPADGSPSASSRYILLCSYVISNDAYWARRRLSGISRFLAIYIAAVWQKRCYAVKVVAISYEASNARMR